MLDDLGRVLAGVDVGDGDAAFEVGVARATGVGGCGREALSRCKVLIGNFVRHVEHTGTG